MMFTSIKNVAPFLMLLAATPGVVLSNNALSQGQAAYSAGDTLGLSQLHAQDLPGAHGAGRLQARYVITPMERTSLQSSGGFAPIQEHGLSGKVHHSNIGHRRHRHHRSKSALYGLRSYSRHHRTKMHRHSMNNPSLVKSMSGEGAEQDISSAQKNSLRKKPSEEPSPGPQSGRTWRGGRSSQPGATSQSGEASQSGQASQKSSDEKSGADPNSASGQSAPQIPEQTDKATQGTADSPEKSALGQMAAGKSSSGKSGSAEQQSSQQPPSESSPQSSDQSQMPSGKVQKRNPGGILRRALFDEEAAQRGAQQFSQSMKPQRASSSESLTGSDASESKHHAGNTYSHQHHGGHDDSFESQIRKAKMQQYLDGEQHVSGDDLKRYQSERSREEQRWPGSSKSYHASEEGVSSSPHSPYGQQHHQKPHHHHHQQNTHSGQHSGLYSPEVRGGYGAPFPYSQYGPLYRGTDPMLKYGPGNGPRPQEPRRSSEHQQDRPPVRQVTNEEMSAGGSQGQQYSPFDASKRQTDSTTGRNRATDETGDLLRYARERKEEKPSCFGRLCGMGDGGAARRHSSPSSPQQRQKSELNVHPLPPDESEAYESLSSRQS